MQHMLGFPHTLTSTEVGNTSIRVVICVTCSAFHYLAVYMQQRYYSINPLQTIGLQGGICFPSLFFDTHLNMYSNFALCLCKM